jgi:predicted ATPase/class 3 adenylate cyclase
MARKRTLTLWQLDIADRATLNELNPELLHQTIRFSEETVDAFAGEFEAFVGQPISVTDCMIVVFELASGAVEIASEFHREAMKQPWHPSMNLFRSAILTADCEISEDGAYMAPQTLECMKTVTRPGQIMISQATYALVRESLSEKHRLLKLGLHHFEDQMQAQFLYQLLHPDLPGEFRPLPSTMEEASNLPTGTTTFIGRTYDLARIKEGFGYAKVVNLVGFGGVGKSRLAIEVGHGQLEYHNHGVRYIDLTGVDDKEEAYRAIATALGLHEVFGSTMEQAVIEKLKKSEMLLIFDNVNSGLEAVSDVINHIEKFCREVQIIATSRKQLSITKCSYLTIGPMDVPDDKRYVAVEDLVQIESVRLFESKVRLHDREFEVDAGNAAQVAQICRALDGIPLSIELAAAKLARFDIGKVAKGLSDVFGLLTKDRRAVGQPNLETAIEWSFDVLKPPQKLAFVRLAIFVADFDLDAARKVAGYDAVPEEEIEMLIEDLVVQAFITKFSKANKTYYRMLGTIREFGLNRAIKSQKLQEMMNRYADYYTNLAKDISPRLYGSELGKLLEEMDFSYPNFVAVLKVAIANAKDQRAPGIILALYIYWHFRSIFREGLKWCQTVLKENRSLKGPARCKVLVITGVMASNTGNYKAADKFFAEAKEIAESEGDPMLMYSVVGSRGNNCHLVGDLALAFEDLSAAKEIARSLDLQSGVADCLGNLANIAIDLGRHEDATKYIEESRRINKTLDRMAASLGRSSFVLGRSARLQGDLDGATEHLGDCLLAYYQMDNPQGVAGALREFAILRVQMGSFHSAAMFFGADEARRKEISLPVPASRKLEYDAAVAKTRAEIGIGFVYDFQRGIEMTDDEILEFLMLQRQIG